LEPDLPVPPESIIAFTPLPVAVAVSLADSSAATDSSTHPTSPVPFGVEFGGLKPLNTVFSGAMLLEVTATPVLEGRMTAKGGVDVGL
jgi:hypothetical protein